MGTVRLNITRDKSFAAAAMPYRIIVNGEELATIKVGKTLSFDIPNSKSTLKIAMVGNAMSFHNIEKQVVLFPEYCKTGEIDCLITTKLNVFGVIFGGLFQPVGRAELKIVYK